jgi:hypothetical protein
LQLLIAGRSITNHLQSLIINHPIINHQSPPIIQSSNQSSNHPINHPILPQMVSQKKRETQMVSFFLALPFMLDPPHFINHPQVIIMFMGGIVCLPFTNQ